MTKTHRGRRIKDRNCKICGVTANYQAKDFGVNWSLCRRHAISAVCNGFRTWDRDGATISPDDAIREANR